MSLVDPNFASAEKVNYIRAADSRSNIAMFVIRAFVYFIFATFAFVAIGLATNLYGLESGWIDGANLFVEIIKIAILPVAMLVLGFYFGRPDRSQ